MADDLRLTLPGMLIGTPAYMAPEQLRGRDVDARADLFALGVVLFELGTGVHPFADDDPASTIARILEVEAPQIGEVSDLDWPELAAVLRRLLEKDPADRHATAAELVADLEHLAERIPPAGAAAERQPAGTSPEDSPAGARDPAARRPAAVTNGDRRSAQSRPRPRHDAFWWWRFHQLAVSAIYGLSYYGLWWIAGTEAVRGFGILTTFLAFGAVAPLIMGAGLRLHLAFASRYYPEQLSAQRRRAIPHIHLAEGVYAVLLLGGAALVREARPIVALGLLAAAVGIVVLSRMIEPATTRAAFPGEE